MFGPSCECCAELAAEEINAAGGLLGNSFLMQVYADVLNRPISILDSAQGPALGSAIHAAVAAGVYDSVAEAAKQMGRRRDHAYVPDSGQARAYDRLYDVYGRLHDYFGREQRGLMRELQSIREAAR